MSGPRSTHAFIAEPALPGAGSMLCAADRGADPAERDPCLAEAPHYAALLRDLAQRLRPLAERREADEIRALADQLDDTAAALEAKERDGASHAPTGEGFRKRAMGSHRP